MTSVGARDILKKLTQFEKEKHTRFHTINTICCKIILLKNKKKITNRNRDLFTMQNLASNVTYVIEFLNTILD